MIALSIRTESVAGAFYPSNKSILLKQLSGFFKSLPKESKSNCVIAPHAGYAYSGKAAAYSFNALKESKCFVILSPNHSGLGSAISVSDADEWQTPLGKIPVDGALRKKLLGLLGIEADDLAHIQEHSIEVQLPFLQFLFKHFKILPITIMSQDLNELIELGNALTGLKEDFSIIASSDFSHFIPAETAKQRDTQAIEKIKQLDVEGFHKMVVQRNLSICGHAPITALMQYCKQKGFKQGKLLRYDSSASTTGDETNVVGYAAIKFEK